MNTNFFPIEEGDIVVVLGAWQGRDVLPHSQKVGDGGLVVAVEPIVENYRVLVRTIMENRALNVIPVLAAMGKETSRGYMHLANINGGFGYDSLRHSLLFDHGKGERVVPVISWDDLMETLCLDHVDLAEVDIEGAEELLLQGMNRVLPDKMIIENHRWLVEDNERKFRISKQFLLSQPDLWENYLNTQIRDKGYKVARKDGIYLFLRRIGA